MANVLKSPIFPNIDFLTLEGLNKALSKSIIIGVSSTSHADLKMMIPQHFDMPVVIMKMEMAV